MNKVILIGLLSVMTGCAGTAYMGDRAEISGTPKGLRAMFDGLNGIAKTAKEKDNAPNQYFAMRNNQEREETVRDTSSGFFQKLFNRENGSQGGS